MDADLQSLFAQLEAAQEKKALVRLSDRVVVDLVNKLKLLGFVGDELLHTINGREYITVAQVKKEIQQALDDAGGRIAIVDLSGLLGVDLVHCQAQAAALVKESGGRVISVQGDLITSSYFDAMAAEVNEMLRDAGAIEMGDIAKQFELAADQVTQHVKSHLGSTIEGTMDANVLYTDTFVARVKGRLRGALRASVSPTSVASLLKAFKLPLPGPSATKLVARLIDDLIQEGCIKGVYKGGGTQTFTPAVYASAQAAAVEAFYGQNAYVEYETLSKMGISNPKTYLRAAFPDGIALEGAYASPSITAQVDAAVEEQAASGGWFDAIPLLPSVLSTADVNKLLLAAPAMKKAATAGSKVLSGTCLISKASLHTWQEGANEQARAAAKAAIAARTAKPAAAPSASERAEPDKKPAGKDDDDWDTGPSKKGKKGKGVKGQRSQAPAAPAKAAEPEDPHCPSLASVSAWLAKTVPELDGCGAEGDLVPTVASELLRAAVAQYQDAVKAAFSVDVQETRRQQEALQQQAVDAVFKLTLYSRGAEALVPVVEDGSDGDAEKAKAERATLERHLLRSSGAGATDAVLRYLKLSAADPGEEAPVASTSGAPMSVSERKAIADALPDDLSPCAKQALKVLELNSSTSSELCSALERALDAAGVRSKKVDKKTEKAAVAAERQSMLLKLQAPGVGAADVLAIAMPCLFAKLRHKLISIPGRSIANVLDVLKADLREEEHDLLSKFHTLVLRQLTAMGKAADEDATTVKECEETLAEMTPALVALC